MHATFLSKDVLHIQDHGSTPLTGRRYLTWVTIPSFNFITNFQNNLFLFCKFNFRLFKCSFISMIRARTLITTWDLLVRNILDFLIHYSIISSPRLKGILTKCPRLGQVLFGFARSYKENMMNIDHYSIYIMPTFIS